jgi:hypothetical protein
MKERYGRDKNNLSRAGTPFYKGDSNDDGRDGVITQVGIKSPPFAISCGK